MKKQIYFAYLGTRKELNKSKNITNYIYSLLTPPETTICLSIVHIVYNACFIYRVTSVFYNNGKNMLTFKQPKNVCILLLNTLPNKQVIHTVPGFHNMLVGL